MKTSQDHAAHSGGSDLRTAHERISYAIKQSSFRKIDIARELKVSATAITMWCNGETKSLHQENLFAFADLIGVSARWIATGQGEMLASDKPDTQANNKDHLALQQSVSAKIVALMQSGGLSASGWRLLDDMLSMLAKTTEKNHV
jgi:transcriptional regulator with XRE-family HTH domain